MILTYSIPKAKQISESIGEEVLWSDKFPIIRGNVSENYWELLPLYSRKSALILGQRTCYSSLIWNSQISGFRYLRI
jgi:hypothetical protein